MHITLTLASDTLKLYAFCAIQFLLIFKVNLCISLHIYHNMLKKSTTIYSVFYDKQPSPCNKFFIMLLYLYNYKED